MNAREEQAAAKAGVDVETFRAVARLDAALETTIELFADAEPGADAIPAGRRPKRTACESPVADFMDSAACKLELLLHRVVLARTVSEIAAN